LHRSEAHRPVVDVLTDLTNSTLPSLVFIEAGYGNNDEHPGSGQSVLFGQAQAANIVNSLMASPEWKNSVFFLCFDGFAAPSRYQLAFIAGLAAAMIAGDRAQRKGRQLRRLFFN
jgi:hypothetical protein